MYGPEVLNWFSSIKFSEFLTFSWDCASWSSFWTWGLFISVLSLSCKKWVKMCRNRPIEIEKCFGNGHWMTASPYRPGVSFLLLTYTWILWPILLPFKMKLSYFQFKFLDIHYFLVLFASFLFDISINHITTWVLMNKWIHSQEDCTTYPSLRVGSFMHGQKNEPPAATGKTWHEFSNSAYKLDNMLA